MRPTTVGFGPYELDRSAGQLRCGGVTIALRPKTWAVLCFLIDHAGRLVSKDELIAHLWGGEAVSDTVPGISVAELRRVLKDNPRQPQYIETVHGRGFRFCAVLEPVAAISSGSGIEWPAAAGALAEPLGHFVGRASELVQIDAFFAARDGARVLFLAGEPGIGKTSLLNAALARVAASDRCGMAIGRGQCPPHFGRGYPFLPMIGALEDLCRGGAHRRDLLRTLAPWWYAQLRHVPVGDTSTAGSETTPPQPDRELDELVNFAQAASPLILAFEDLHCADHATLDLLVVLAEHPGLPQCRVLGTYRPTEAIATKHPIGRARREMERHGRARELMLTGLDQAGVAAYVAARLSGAVCPDWLSADLLARSSGNPLFLTVSVEYLINAGGLAPNEGVQVVATERYPQLSREIPDTLRELVLQRFVEHTPHDQTVLAHASVVGLDADAAAIAATLDESVAVVDADCAALARSSTFLRRNGESLWPNGSLSGRYTFRHPLYQRVLYDELAPAARSLAHRRIATALIDAFDAQVPAVAAVIADHFDRAHMLPEAIDYHRRAARYASQQHASSDALVHLHRALALQKDSGSGGAEGEAAILSELGSTLPAVEGLTGSAFGALFARARRLHAGSADVLEAATTLAGLAIATLVGGNARDAESLARELLALSTTHDAPIARGLAALAMGAVLYHQGEIVAALEHLERDCGDAAQMLAFGPIDLRTGRRALQTPILWQAGRPDDAIEQAADALVTAESGPHPFNVVLALQAGAVVQHCCGHRDKGLAAAIRLGAAAEEQGIHEVKAMARMIEASWRAGVNADEIVVPLIDAGVDACRTYGTVLTHVYVLVIGAETLIRIGRPTQAQTVLDEVRERIAAGAARFWEPELHRLQGELHRLRTARGRTVAAEDCFRRALNIANQQGSHSLALRAAISVAAPLRQQQRTKEAAQLLATSLDGIHGGEHTRDVRDARALLQRLQR